MPNLMITRKIKFVPKFGTSQITVGYDSMRVNGNLKELGEQFLKVEEEIVEPLIRKEQHVFHRSI